MLKVNSKNKAKSLISSGNIDFSSSWSFSSEDGNKLLGENGNDWTKFSSVHLAENPDIESNTKNKYAYPIGKLKGNILTIYRGGVIAAKQAAAGARGASKNTEIFNLASTLLDMINKKMDTADKKCPDCGTIISEDDKKCPNCNIDLCGSKKKKKKDSIEKIEQRYDFYDFTDNDWMVEKLQKTPEGYLTGRARVTNIGVFPYVNNDGTVRRELRLPEEVFSFESFNSLKSKPVTNNHPDTKINVDNIKEYQVGFIGDEIRTDPYFLSAPITITDKATINEIEQRGKKGLSCGYMVSLDETPGVFLGMPYDAIQRNIKYNHVAVVDKGRAGDLAVLKLDNCNIAYRLVGDSQNNLNKEGFMPELNLKEIKIDGVNYQAEAEVVKTYHQEKTRADQEKDRADKLQEGLSKTEAERDNLKAKVDLLEKELKENKLDESKIQKAVEKKLNLLTAAYELGIEIKVDAAEIDIQKTIIMRAFPDAKLDGKDQLYIDGRFDGALELLKKQKSNENSIPFSSLPLNTDGEVYNVDANKARMEMIKRMQNRHKMAD